MSDVSKYTGGIPPLHTIKDVDTRRVLEAIVAGWRTRNGDLKPDSDERFITKGELKKLVEDVNAGYFVSGPGADLVTKAVGENTDVQEYVKRLLDATTLDVVTNKLWAQLGSRIKPVDTSSIRTDIFQLQDELDKANATLDTATEDILKLADGTTDIVVKTDGGTTSIRAIKDTVYDEKTGLAAATAAIGEINNISVSSSSAAATQIAAVVAQVNDTTTGLAAANANITAINDVSATSSSAAAKALYGVRATVNDENTGLAAANASITAINDVSASSSSAAAKALFTVTATTNQKNRTFFAGEKPASDDNYTLVAGDLWFNTADNNKPHRWNGTDWDETADTRIATAESAITSEQKARVNSDNALAAAVNTIWAALGDGNALVQSGEEAVTNVDGAVAKAWNQVDAALKGPDGSYISSVSVLSESSAAVTKVGVVEGRYSVKVDNNGYVTGFGLISEENNGKTSSAFIFNADSFAIAGPLGADGKPGDIKYRVPFKVYTKKATAPDGVSEIEPGVYIDEFVLGNGTIGTAKIGDAAITSAKIGDAAITSAKIGLAEVDTLRIAGNAVTVPVGVTSMATLIAGSGKWVTALATGINLDQPGWVYAACSAYLVYGTGWRFVETRLYIAGQLVAFGGGAEGWTNAAHSGSVYCEAGPVIAQLEFFGRDSGVKLAAPSIFMQAVKR